MQPEIPGLLARTNWKRNGALSRSFRGYCDAGVSARIRPYALRLVYVTETDATAFGRFGLFLCFDIRDVTRGSVRGPGAPDLSIF